MCWSMLWRYLGNKEETRRIDGQRAAPAVWLPLECVLGWCTCCQPSQGTRGHGWQGWSLLRLLTAVGWPPLPGQGRGLGAAQSLQNIRVCLFRLTDSLVLAPKACELPLADAECSNIAQMAVSSTEVVYVLFHAFSPALTKYLCAGSAGLAQLLLSREAFRVS